MKRRTIKSAAIQALRISAKPEFAKDIYSIIVENDLYRFNAQRPADIVKVEIRRHCTGLDFPSSRPDKYFQILRDGRYWIKDESVPGLSEREGKVEARVIKESLSLKDTLAALTTAQADHTRQFRQNVIAHLKKLDPTDFELFSNKLLEVYGFKDMDVTQASKDGGIDGHGKLKVGITFLEVAFQSKRWNTNPVSQKEIQSFRGSIQGKCEQGIYFTTSTFTKGAKEVSVQKGAVPIVLIDGKLIVDIMIEKGFGVQVDYLKAYAMDLESIFSSA